MGTGSVRGVALLRGVGLVDQIFYFGDDARIRPMLIPGMTDDITVSADEKCLRKLIDLI